MTRGHGRNQGITAHERVEQEIADIMRDDRYNAPLRQASGNAHSQNQQPPNRTSDTSRTGRQTGRLSRRELDELFPDNRYGPIRRGIAEEERRRALPRSLEEVRELDDFYINLSRRVVRDFSPTSAFRYQERIDAARWQLRWNMRPWLRSD